MRESQITELLKELSKRAKELGFPQVIEEGDWIAWEDEQASGISLVDREMLKRMRAWASDEDTMGLDGHTHWVILDMSEVEAKACIRILEEENAHK